MRVRSLLRPRLKATVSALVTGVIAGSMGLPTGPLPLTILGTPGAPQVGVAYSFVPTVAGGVLPYTFALTGTLPAGLSFSPTTGAITGTPTAAGTTSGLSIGVTGSAGQTASLGPFSLVVAAASGVTPQASDTFLFVRSAKYARSSLATLKAYANG